MTDIKSLETRLVSAIKRIEDALKASQPPAQTGDTESDLAAENAELREQLIAFREERKQDLAVIDQIMSQITNISENEDA